MRTVPSAPQRRQGRFGTWRRAKSQVKKSSPSAVSLSPNQSLPSQGLPAAIEGGSEVSPSEGSVWPLATPRRAPPRRRAGGSQAGAEAPWRSSPGDGRPRPGSPRRAPYCGGVPETEPAIELRGLRREFGGRVALDGVDLDLARGATLAVLGPNGSGKTTLLRILAGLLRPSAGRARVLGCELPGESWKLRGRVGYLAHRPLLYRDLTPRENLRFVARLHGLEATEAEARIAELLAAVGMEPRGDDPVAELSAGMAQRVGVCLALLHHPELLLLDEPDSHLDAGARESVERLLAGAGATRVLVTH